MSVVTHHSGASHSDSILADMHDACAKPPEENDNLAIETTTRSYVAMHARWWSASKATGASHEASNRLSASSV